jgi:proteasome lid subunit RPN8/RPN11
LDVQRLRTAVIDAIVDHARTSVPDECCGMLIGSDRTIDLAVPARNIAPHPTTRFLIEPRDHLEALRAARRSGRDVVGFYHSHPRSAALPSAVDRAEASYPDHLFLIVGLGGGTADVRLYRFCDGNFELTPFVTVAE